MKKKIFTFLGTLLLILLITASAFAKPTYKIIDEDGFYLDDYSIAINGNIDDDAFKDILIGDFTYGEYESGKVYLFFGKNLTSSNVIDLKDADYIFSGDSETELFGSNVSFTADEDGDNLSEILITSEEEPIEDVFYSSNLDRYKNSDVIVAGQNSKYSTRVGVNIGVSKNVGCSLNPIATGSANSGLLFLLGTCLITLTTFRFTAFSF